MSARRRFAALAACAALLLGGCSMGDKDYRDAVEESVRKSDAYDVDFVTSERVGLGAKYIVVAVDFYNPPTDSEFADLVRNVTAPFPEGSQDGVRLNVVVTTDPDYSLGDTFGMWFEGALAMPREIITDVSAFREGVEGR